jgi:hypothetical protein
MLMGSMSPTRWKSPSSSNALRICWHFGTTAELHWGPRTVMNCYGVFTGENRLGLERRSPLSSCGDNVGPAPVRCVAVAPVSTRRVEVTEHMWA